MQSTIEYCHGNADAELNSILSSLNGDHVGRSCLDHCGLCRCAPFVVIDGTLFTGAALTQQMPTSDPE